MLDDRYYEKAFRIPDSPLWDEVLGGDILAVEFFDGTFGYVNMEEESHLPDLEESSMHLNVCTGEDGERFLCRMIDLMEGDDEAHDWDVEDASDYDGVFFEYDEDGDGPADEVMTAREIISISDTFTSRDCMQLIFRDEGSIGISERSGALLSAARLGLPEPDRDALPVFRRFRFGRSVSDEFSEDDLAHFSEALDAVLKLDEMYRDGILSVEDMFYDANRQYMLPLLRRDGSIGLTEIPVSPQLHYRGIIGDKQSASRVRKQKKTDEWECMVCPLLDIHDDGVHGIYFPMMLYAYSLGYDEPVCRVLMERTGESFTELSVDEFLFVLESSEVRPLIIHARDTRTRELLSDMCRRTGIILSVREDTPKVEDFFADFMLSTFGDLLRPDWFDDEEEFEDGEEELSCIDELYDLVFLMSDRELKNMPENILNYIRYLNFLGKLPGDIKRRMDKVLGKGWHWQEGYPKELILTVQDNGETDKTQNV